MKLKGQSDTKPDSQLKSRGRTQVLYNINEKTVTDEQTSKTRTVWDYDYVEIDGTVTKAKVMAAIQQADADSDASAIIPDDIVAQHDSAKSELSLSKIAGMTYAQVDNYIDANVTDLASARAFLKKLARVVMAMLKRSA